LAGQPLKQEADWKGLIARTGLSADDAAALLASLPAEFRTNRDVQGIELTMTALITARSAPDGFGFRRLETSCGIRLGLALRDRPQLLADIAAVLSAHALDIRDCRIWQSPDGFAMQNITTVPVSPARWTEEDAWKRLEKDLRQAALPGFDAKTFLTKRRRPIKPEIRLEQGTGERHTVLDVRAKDRPGLLSDLTRTIGQAGLNIEYACISTLGDMAVDVFYLSLCNHKLPDAKARELREMIAQALSKNSAVS
jgi:[protein-PII] uridylyltransferase